MNNGFTMNNGALVVYALSFLDVKTLLQKESVNKAWRNLWKQTIHSKCGQNGPKAFESNEELRDAVAKYRNYDASAMEEIACTYGYPIDKWDVFQVKDMTCVFEGMYKFNESIESWDMSSVVTMKNMFFWCGSLQQRYWNLECFRCDRYGRGFQ
jgi:hypothetical protein